MLSEDGYRSLRETAGLVRRGDRGVLRVTGADRATWLQGLVTNDVLALAPGERRYSAYLTPQGRMMTDLHVVASAAELWLDVPAPLAASLCARLDGLIFAEDAQVADVSGEMAVWGVYGPAAAAAVADLPSPAFHDDEFGVPGFVWYLDAARPLPAALAALPEVPLDTLDVLRIEAGTPRFLVDMDERTIPLEAGLEDRAISFTKGCYVGQEVIVRVTQRGGGRVAKKLVRLTVAGTAVPDAGAPLFVGEREVGRVTSAAWSPALDAVVALGYVARDFTDPATPLVVVSGDGRHDAVIR